MGHYVQNLIVRVINASEADNWENAVQEWEIVDCEEDEDLSESCVCGKEELRYLFTIRNVYNGNLLFPIGSSCIKPFPNYVGKAFSVFLDNGCIIGERR